MKIISFNLDQIEHLLESRSLDQLSVIGEEMKNEIKKGNAVGFESDGLSHNEVSVFHEMRELYSFYNNFLESRSHLLFRGL
jgi:hypothetical protein